MTKKANWSAKLLTWFCVGLMVLALCSIGLRMFTRVLVKHFGMNNVFTKIVFFDAENYANNVFIDWADLYPFVEEDMDTKEADAEEMDAEKSDNTIRGRLKELVLYGEEKLEEYCTDNLMGYSFFTEKERAYKKDVRWNYASYGEYNGVVELPDGMLVSYVGKLDVQSDTDAVVSLAEFCEGLGTDFLYVTAPGKICRYEDSEVSGTLDFSNQNADELMQRLSERGVDTYDLRDELHEQGMNHHDAFYRTDHHWRGETGLWATQQIMTVLRDDYGYKVSPELLDAENFRSELYPDWFLGSLGRKVTLMRTDPEDFCLLYPTYETALRFQVPTIPLDVTGDFSVCYDMDRVAVIDYYNEDPYQAYGYGRRAVNHLENLLAGEDAPSILLIRESFSDCVIPFMALCGGTLDAIDPASFTGSIRSYIEQTRPDIVMVLYSAHHVTGSVEFETHTDYFDFR